MYEFYTCQGVNLALLSHCVSLQITPWMACAMAYVALYTMLVMRSCDVSVYGFCSARISSLPLHSRAPPEEPFRLQLNELSQNSVSRGDFSACAGERSRRNSRRPGITERGIPNPIAPAHMLYFRNSGWVSHASLPIH